MVSREERVSGPVAPEIVIQADIGGITIAFTELVTSADQGKIDERLDLYHRAIARQRAYGELRGALIDLASRWKVLKDLPRRERDLAKSRVEERVRMVAGFEARFTGRTEFRLNEQQRSALRSFDEDTEKQKAEHAVMRDTLIAEIAQYEAVVERQQAILDGAEATDLMKTEVARLSAPAARSEAAD